MRRSYRRNKSCGVLIWKEEEAEERTGNVRADRSPQVNSTDPFSDTLACQSRKNTAGIKSINDSRIPFRWAGSRARLLAWNGTGPTLMVIFTPGLLRLQPMTAWRMDGVRVTSSKLQFSAVNFKPQRSSRVKMLLTGKKKVYPGMQSHGMDLTTSDCFSFSGWTRPNLVLRLRHLLHLQPDKSKRKRCKKWRN